MPNHVYLQMQITGDPIIIKEFAEKHFDGETLDVNSFIPMPEELCGTTSPSQPPRNATEIEIARFHKTSTELTKKYGNDNWYDWCCKNWGTKWGAYDGTMDVVTDTQIDASFQTAWSLPEPVFEKIAEMYPTLTVAIQTVEEGGFFGGTVDIVEGRVHYALSEDKWKEYAEMILGWVDEDEDGTDNCIESTLLGLQNGSITDQSVVNEMVKFIKENKDKFIEFVTPK